MRTAVFLVAALSLGFGAAAACTETTPWEFGLIGEPGEALACESDNECVLQRYEDGSCRRQALCRSLPMNVNFASCLRATRYEVCPKPKPLGSDRKAHCLEGHQERYSVACISRQSVAHKAPLADRAGSGLADTAGCSTASRFPSVQSS